MTITLRFEASEYPDLYAEECKVRKVLDAIQVQYELEVKENEEVPRHDRISEIVVTVPTQTITITEGKP